MGLAQGDPDVWSELGLAPDFLAAHTTTTIPPHHHTTHLDHHRTDKENKEELAVVVVGPMSTWGWGGMERWLGGGTAVVVLGLCAPLATTTTPPPPHNPGVPVDTTRFPCSGACILAQSSGLFSFPHFPFPNPTQPDSTMLPNAAIASKYATKMVAVSLRECVFVVTG